ncbi:MAG: hypothetical protein A2017_21810 [Lentisphaerae bacterium GWF2_44_16]|nr:MAG: hypothetical protein A2017_21810 [Lentisphaerae bacterium GWF2_44_16]
MNFSLPHSTNPLVAVNTHYESDKKSGKIHYRYIVGNMYIEGIIKSKGLPLIVPKTENEAVLDLYAEKADAFLFIGGPDYPPEFYGEDAIPEDMSCKNKRPFADLYLMRKAIASKKPVLGICAGEQLLSIASGGKLIQHVKTADQHTGEKYHKARICGGNILKSLIEGDSFEINSSHHQAVNPKFQGKGLLISAFAEDGTVEAIEGTGREFRLGLQFHIERHKGKKFRKRVFDLLIKKAEEYRNEQKN